MATAKRDITIPQTSAYRLIVTVYGGPTSLTGYNGAMEIRRAKADVVPLATVGADCFVVDDLNRQVVLTIPSQDTGLYDWDGKAFYDLYVESPTDPEDRWRLVEGVVTLSKTVTRDED